MTLPTRADRMLVAVVATGTVAVACLVWGLPLPVEAVLGALVLANLSRACLGDDPLLKARPEPAPAEAIADEVERSRRYGRPCTVAVVSDTAQGSGATRRTDRAWDIDGELILLMPETTGPEAQLALARLLGDPFDGRVAVATFPDDQLTVHGLLDALRSPIDPVATAPVAGPIPIPAEEAG